MEFDFEEQIEQLAKVPKAVRLAVVVSLLLGVCAGYYFFYYEASRQELQQMRGRAQQLQRQLNKVRIVANNLGEFEQEVADLERDLDQALSQLPDKKQFEDLLQDITTAGKRVGVTIKSITRGKEVRHDFYAEVPFTIELEGSFHDIALFFERVSRLPRIVNIGTMSMNVDAETQRETVLRVTGKATTFRFLGAGDRAASTRTNDGADRA